MKTRARHAKNFHSNKSHVSNFFRVWSENRLSSSSKSASNTLTRDWLRAWRSTSRKGLNMQKIIQMSIILAYAVVGNVRERPTKLLRKASEIMFSLNYTYKVARTRRTVRLTWMTTCR